jgi:hypothetical protein
MVFQASDVYVLGGVIFGNLWKTGMLKKDEWAEKSPNQPSDRRFRVLVCYGFESLDRGYKACTGAFKAPEKVTL